MRGHGMKVIEIQGEAIDDVYGAIQEAMNIDGPVAVVIHRKMAPGIGELEGQTHAHDAIPVKDAIEYLKKRDLPAAIEMLESVPKTADPYEYKGVGDERVVTMQIWDTAGQERFQSLGVA